MGALQGRKQTNGRWESTRAKIQKKDLSAQLFTLNFSYGN